MVRPDDEPVRTARGIVEWFGFQVEDAEEGVVEWMFGAPNTQAAMRKQVEDRGEAETTGDAVRREIDVGGISSEAGAVLSEEEEAGRSESLSPRSWPSAALSASTILDSGRR